MTIQPEKWRGEKSVPFPEANEILSDAVGLRDGGFAIVHQDGARILITRYDAFGEPVGTNPFITINGEPTATTPKIALLSNGNVVVTGRRIRRLVPQT